MAWGRPSWGSQVGGQFAPMFITMGIPVGEGYTEALVANVSEPVKNYTYVRAAKDVLYSISNGQTYIPDSGIYEVTAQVVYNIGNQDADVELSLFNEFDQTYPVHITSRYGKGGIGDNIVLTAMGEFVGEVWFSLHITCSITTSMDIIEADFGIKKIAKTSSIVARVG